MADSNELLLFLKTVDRDVRIHLPEIINEDDGSLNHSTLNSSANEVNIIGENISLEYAIKTQDDAQNGNDPSKKARLVKPEHICTVCNKAFKRRDHLKEHFLIHTGERPHTCHICQKSFKRRSSLTAHFMTHQDARPYECSICSKSFKTASKLNVHNRSHSIERRNEIKSAIENKIVVKEEHECGECGLRFTNFQDLNLHFRIHITKTPSKNTQVEPPKHNKCDSSSKQSDVDAVVISIDQDTSLHTLEEEIYQKNSSSDTVKVNENEDFSIGDYEEWSKHFHMTGVESENEDYYTNEENDFMHKEMEEGISLNCHEDYSKTKNSGLVGYSFHRTKILNFPDY